MKRDSDGKRVAGCLSVISKFCRRPQIISQVLPILYKSPLERQIHVVLNRRYNCFHNFDYCDAVLLKPFPQLDIEKRAYLEFLRHS